MTQPSQPSQPPLFPLDFSTLPPAATPHGVHHLEKGAACPASAFFRAQERELEKALAAAGEIPTQSYTSGEAAATGTVGHALMAWGLSDWRLNAPASEIAALIAGEALQENDTLGWGARLELRGCDHPSVSAARFDLAQAAAAYAYLRFRLCFENVNEILGTEIKHAMTLRALDGGVFPLTGGLDLAANLSEASCERFRQGFGTALKPGLTVFDFKFIDYVANAHREVNGHQHLSYQLLAGNKFDLPVSNFVYVIVQKSKAEVRKPKLDMTLIRKPLPTAQTAVFKLAILEKAGRFVGAGVEPAPEDYRISACVNLFGNSCRFAPDEGGQCHQGLIYSFGEE